VLLVYFAHFAGGADAASAMDGDLFAAMRAQGHEVVVLSPFRDPSAGRIAGDVGGGRLARLALALPGYARMLSRGLREARDPTAKVASQYHVFHPATAVAFLAARLRGRPLVVRAHDPLPGSYRSEAQGAIFRAAFHAYRAILRHRQTHVLVPSPELRAAASERLGLPPERVRVVPNNVTPFREADPLAVEALRDSLGLRGARVVLQFGSFTERGTATFVEAVRRSPPTVRGLVLADPWRGRTFAEEARRQAIPDRIVVVPTQPHAKLADYLALADACVGLLSADPLAFGSLPRSTLEAMAAGRPVVLCRGGASSTLVEDGGNSGLLVPPENAAALAAALARVFEDATLAADLGRRARETVLARFHSDVVARSFASVIEGIP
jgi:glycosyltransferase involved in cell wall biosynthesis